MGSIRIKGGRRLRRSPLVATAVAGCALAFGAAVSPAKQAGQRGAKSVTCKLLVSDAIPQNTTTVPLPLIAGVQYGSASCNKGVGNGLTALTVKLNQLTGAISGSIYTYFALGSIDGKYALTESASQPSPTPYVFGNADYTGKINMTAGSGAYAGAKGIGKIRCVTNDSIHFSCDVRLKLKLPKA
jgi:hypothetical protein